MRQNEAAEAVSGMWWALSKIFQGKKEKKKERRTDGGREGERNWFESWLAVEAAAPRLSRPQFWNSERIPPRRVHRRTGDPGPEVLFQRASPPA